ncbi:Lipin/Ned1/Smp2-domain-containing protein [Absidia repens]|uniref:phosphatidate phosphatase n=1 Tax=Absidia repens TaxID=90262 RepID=A0A1X2ITS5_9FUNG|nr:Lipin/Ned1/Smp2-domain-containing protein [Absidia repens]
MEYVGKLGSLFTSVSSFYNDINPATLSGAVDIVVVEQKDGDLACSPFHVRFGKLSLLMPQEKKIEIKVNGQVVPYLMKVGEAGESFFVFETEHEVPEEFQTSPIVGAVNESKTDEDPPFLDIGESKNQGQDDQQQEQHKDMKDQFEDDDATDDHMKLPLPAELQSPKMIIEEQMDKVVTNMDPYSSSLHHHHQHPQQHHQENDAYNRNAITPSTIPSLQHDIDKLTFESNSTTRTTEIPSSTKFHKDTSVAPQNDVYPMDDGSALLERVIPEAITTTTIAKETFIVRPANGDIYSKAMDVSHRSVHKRNGGLLTSSDYTNTGNIDNDNKTSHDNTGSPSSLSTKLDHSSHSTSYQQQQQQQRHQQQHDNGDIDNDEQQAHGHNESIVLDIAGYKTGERAWDEGDEQNQVDNIILSKLEDEMTTHDIDGSMDLSESGNLDLARAESPEAFDGHPNTLPQDISTAGSNNNDTSAAKPNTTTTTGLWGWGSARRRGTNESQNSIKTDNDDEADDSTSIGTDMTKATDISQIDEHDKITHSNNDSDNNNGVTTLKYQLVPGTTYRIEMSLCGLSAFGYDEKENAKAFEDQQMTYDTFMHNPNLLNDKRLVFRYERRYFAAGNTGPLFTSLLLYKKPLQETTSRHDGHHPTSASGSGGSNVEDSRESYLFGKGWRQWLSRSSVAAPSSSTSSSASTAGGDGTENFSEDKTKTPSSSSSTTTTTVDKNDNTTTASTSIPADDRHDDMTTTFTTTTKTTTVGWNAEHNHDNSSNGHGSATNPMDLVPRKNYAKTLRLTSEQLKQLHLNKGVNTISFSVTSAYQGTATCAAKIFYWDYDMPIVISDIDGTITKSDALGHVFTMIGKDWTHHGVAKLYTDIYSNGYKILYLTSRAIGQADYTRDYLKKVEQGNYQLPDGPVIMSPDRLFTSFHREVIMRKPEVFKMACLKDIQRLFGGRDPFYAGFGNRITDAISYRSVSVPASRIFTIDPYGDIKLELLKGFTSSYIHLNDLVDQIFPPVNTKSVTTDEEYNDWNFWKQPLPAIDLPEEVTDTKKSPPTSPKPKPIKPDLSSLPSETIAASEKQQQAASSRGGLLRSLTSMSTSSATSSSSSLLSDAGIPARQQSPPPPPSHVPTSNAHTSALPSTSSALSASPIATTANATSTSIGRNRVHSFTTTLRQSSPLLGSSATQQPPLESSSSTSMVPATLAQQESKGHNETTGATDNYRDEKSKALNNNSGGDNNVVTNLTDDDDRQRQQRPESPTSPGLMNHISNGIGGVRNTLSRTFAYGSQGDTSVGKAENSNNDAIHQTSPDSPKSTSMENDSVDSTRNKDEERHQDDDNKHDELEDDLDEEFDTSLDDLEHDMDDIPFI